MSRVRVWAVNIAIVVVVLGVGLYVRSVDQEVERQSAETHEALCSFKRDLEGRRFRLWEFRNAGRTIEGITLTDINRSLSTQRQTLDSLTALDCD